jgi:hypothetical protein
MVKENKNQIFNDYNSKQEIVSITYEEIGFFPRSFSRVLDRFLKQVFSDVENLVIQEYRFYRYLFLTTLKCLLILFFVPFLINFFSKNYLVRPLTEYFWNTQQNEIFLNSYQQKRAFSELKDFEEKIYFESLINLKDNSKNSYASILNGSGSLSQNLPLRGKTSPLGESFNDYPTILNENEPNIKKTSERFSKNVGLSSFGEISQSFEEAGEQPNDFVILDQKPAKRYSFEQRLQEKTIELALRYNNQSIEAITNFFADLISFITLCYLLFALEIQINITKSFLLEVFFGLDDSKKSLLILLITDLLVGYHSSNLWELFFEFLFTHYGLPESQTGIFLLVATLPVLLDVLFKYLIFRHLNRSSPATVATYHAMIE